MVIYHGEVTEDSDGPAECALPVLGGLDLGGLQHRTEPAHREAFTRITVAQVEYPQIMSAYEAVDQWTREYGREVTGPPREVYLPGFADRGPHEDGCDIAFPVAGG